MSLIPDAGEVGFRSESHISSKGKKRKFKPCFYVKISAEDYTWESNHGDFQFLARWSASTGFHFCVYFVCDCQFLTSSLSLWLPAMCVYLCVWSRGLCLSLPVWPAVLCGFVCMWPSVFHAYFCLWIGLLPLSLSVIKTFSFTSSCVSVTFSFVILSSSVNSSFFVYFCLWILRHVFLSSSVTFIFVRFTLVSRFQFCISVVLIKFQHCTLYQHGVRGKTETY